MNRTTQIKIIHILKNKHGLDEDTYRAMLISMFGVNSSTLLNDMQCAALIAKLNTPSQNNPLQASQKQLLYIEDLFQNSPISNRQGWLHRVLGKAVELSKLNKKEAIKVIDALKRYPQGASYQKHA